MSIICLGELIVDRYVGGRDPVCFAGGSAANVAIGLRRLGVSTALWTQVGADQCGIALRDACGREGLPLEPIAIDPDHPTRIANIRLGPAGEPSFDIVNRDSADQYLTPALIAPDTIRNARILHFSGTTLLGASTYDTLRHVLGNARDVGLHVSFDPNVRIARGSVVWERLQQVLPMVSVLKVSAPFLAQNWPELDAVQVRECLGLRLLVVTLGAAGARLVSEGVDLMIPAQPAQVVDTTGAGDAWTASFLNDLVRVPDVPQDAATLRTWAETAARRAAHACEQLSATATRLADQACPSPPDS